MRVALLLFAALLLPTAGAAAAPRAVWVWEQDSRELLLSREAANSAAAFLRARGVTTLYLYADNFKGANLLESRPELYRALLRRLHRRGFRVYALLGSAYLHTEEYVLPGRRNDALAMLRCALAYNAASAPDQRFDGVNVDIEPYILPQWSTQRDRLLRLYLDLGRALMELKRSSTVSFPVGPAIPFWFDGITLDWNGSNKPVSGHVFDIYDYAAIMDYRDHAEGRDGLIALAAGELASASRAGRKVKIGVEISKGEPQKISFSHLKEADLERELAEAEAAFSKEPAFDGFVIHHLGSYRAWLRRQEAAGR